MTYDAIVLAGGRGSRLGGIDKPAAVVGDRPMIDIARAALHGAAQIFVVGPEVDGGPVAALAAALPGVTADLVAILAADLPFVTAAAVEGLVGAIGDAAAVVALDADGRDQPLLACYRADAIRDALPTPATGAAMRILLAALDPVRRIDLGGDPPICWDCDTPADLNRARKLA